MRALCGAIITAGALIGLGLAALGFGTRYQDIPRRNAEGAIILLKWSEMDRPLMFALIFLASAAVIGLGIAILGLAYHHERRNRELQAELQRAMVEKNSGQRLTVP
jgi:hypothetical protein